MKKDFDVAIIVDPHPDPLKIFHRTRLLKSGGKAIILCDNYKLMQHVKDSRRFENILKYYDVNWNFFSPYFTERENNRHNSQIKNNGSQCQRGRYRSRYHRQSNSQIDRSSSRSRSRRYR